MKLFRWIKGRQDNTIYYKWCFMFFRIGRWGFDGYILKYPPLTVLAPHVDLIDGKMWRVNIKLRGKARFFYDGETQLSIGDWVHVFTPAIKHSLVAYTRTIKLSFGIAHFNKKTNGGD